MVSGRYSLWGNSTDTSGDMVGVKAMITKIKTLTKDATSPDGYSIIPVHAWSHTYDDVVAVATALQAESGFDVVLPSELIKRVKANVPPSARLPVV